MKYDVKRNVTKLTTKLASFHTELTTLKQLTFVYMK